MTSPSISHTLRFQDLRIRDIVLHKHEAYAFTVREVGPDYVLVYRSLRVTAPAEWVEDISTLRPGDIVTPKYLSFGPCRVTGFNRDGLDAEVQRRLTSLGGWSVVVPSLTALSLPGCGEKAVQESTPAILATRDARSSLVRLEHLIPEQATVEGWVSSGQGQRVIDAVNAAKDQYAKLGEALTAMEAAVSPSGK